jgi:hypothetical protein
LNDRLYHRASDYDGLSTYLLLAETLTFCFSCAGACEQSASEGGNDTLPFPDFPACNLVETSIYTLIDSTEVEPKIVQDLSVEHIRDDFASFNTESTVARIVYYSPIEVNASLYISMLGVQTKMNDMEAKFFVEAVVTSLKGMLELNNTEPATFEIQDVHLQHQESSTGKRLRRLAEEDAFNKVDLFISATCGNAAVCTNEALQTLVDTEGLAYGKVLQVALAKSGELLYFDDITDVQIVNTADHIPELPAAKEQSTGEEPGTSSQSEMPKWLWSVIVIILSTIAFAVAYTCFRRAVRRIQGERLKDPEEAATRRGSSHFTAAPAPTLAQVKELENEHHYSETKEQYNGPRKSLQELVEDDYDARSYGDEFSVEAGDFTVADGYEASDRRNNSKACS